MKRTGPKKSLIPLQPQTSGIGFTDLVPDIVSKIIAYLDVTDNLNMRLVSHQMKEPTQEPFLWRIWIEKYFPYLRDTKIDSVITHPQTLLIKTYQKYKQLISKEWFVPYRSVKTIPNILAALSGQIEKIAKIKIDAKYLYVLAAANGHLAAVEKLDEDGKYLAFERAVLNGNFSAINILWDKISLGCKEANLQPAIRKRHLNIVKKLCPTVNEEVLSTAFKQIISTQNLELLQVFLGAGAQINLDDLITAQRDAAIKAQRCMVDVIQHYIHAKTHVLPFTPLFQKDKPKIIHVDQEEIRIETNLSLS